jgi:hypothetical protein
VVIVIVTDKDRDVDTTILLVVGTTKSIDMKMTLQDNPPDSMICCLAGTWDRPTRPCGAHLLVDEQPGECFPDVLLL